MTLNSYPIVSFKCEMAKFDILSEVFATLRLRSDLYFEAELGGDFSVQIPRQRRHIRFHLVRQGHCWLEVPGGKLVELSEGDLAIVPNGSEQILSRSPGVPPVALSALLERGAYIDGVLSHGSGGGVVRLLCGFCQFDEGIDHPVIVKLPSLVIVRPSDLGAEPWAATALRLLALESDLQGEGMTGILSRVLEIIFLQSVRRMHAGEPQANGFIAALSDAHLSRALHAMHDQPDVAWTISALAELAGMSRGRFAEKFTREVGAPPIGYLTSWRLMKARALLVNSSLDMAEIARRCGYRSVPSFTRRFKKVFKVGPGEFRRLAGSLPPQT